MPERIKSQNPDQEPPKLFPLKSEITNVIINIDQDYPYASHIPSQPNLPIHNLADAAACHRKAAHQAFINKDKEDEPQKTSSEKLIANLNMAKNLPPEDYLSKAMVKAGLAEFVTIKANKKDQYRLSYQALIHQNPQGNSQLLILRAMPEFLAITIRREGLLPEKEKEMLMAMHLIDNLDKYPNIIGANFIYLPLDANYQKPWIGEEVVVWNEYNKKRSEELLKDWQKARSHMNRGQHPDITAQTVDICKLCDFNTICTDRPQTETEQNGQLKLGI